MADQQAPATSIPASHMIIIQQITVQDISSMVPLKLINTNYTTWKSHFLHVLKNYGVEGLVHGTEICPPALMFDENGKIIDHVNITFEKWMDRDQNVMVWLNSRNSEDLLPYTVEASSSHALWMILEKRFANASHCHFG